MKGLKNLIGVFAFSLLVLALPAVASAQWRNDDDYYGNNRGRQTDNRYLKATVERLKNNAKEFDRRLDRELNRRNSRNYSRSILALSDDFKDATDELEDNFGNGRNMRNTQDEARQVIQVGQQLERELYSQRFDFNVTNDWNSIRQDLQQIANAYGLSYNSRGGWGNRNGNGGWRDRLPIQLPF